MADPVTYAIFNPDLGDLIVQNMPLGPQDEGMLVWEVQPGTDPNTLYVKGGELKILPQKPPGPRVLSFDLESETWIDPRTPSDLQAELYAAREATSMDRSTLLIRMAMAGMLPADEAEIAAGGIIPPSIQAVLDALPPEVFPPEAQMVARIKWRSDNVISRVNPVIVLAAAALGVTDEQMDAIFEVRAPE